MVIIYTILVALILSFLLGFLLGFFKKIFYIKVDPLQEQIRSVLPGANCGGCGYPGCDGYAASCASGIASADGCTAGGVAVAKAIGEILGVSVSAEKQVILLACQGSKEHAQPKGEYVGVKTCAAAKLAINGTKMCSWGCIGFGDCVNVCKFNALSMGEDGLPHVDKKNCTGCGMCVKTCPQKLFMKLPDSQEGAIALCSNRSQIKASILKNCKKGCIKCGKCERSCKKGAIKLVDGIPVVDYTLCDSCGDCVAGCPTHVLKLLQDI